MSIMKEIWKDIPNYYGLYQASNTGKIRSLDAVVSYERKGNIVTRKRFGKILKPCNNRYGYPMVVLTKPNHRKCHSVHRLILLAFIGDSDLTVNHVNGIKEDNRLENLEYTTMSQNLHHAYKIGLKTKTKNFKYTKKCIDKIKAALKQCNYRWYLAQKITNIPVKNMQYAIKTYDYSWYEKNRPRSKT